MQLYFDYNPSLVILFIIFLLLLLSKPKKESKKRMKDYIVQDKQIDYLKEKISKSHFYSLIHVSDEIMCINKDQIIYLRARVLACKRFVHNLFIVVV